MGRCQQQYELKDAFKPPARHKKGELHLSHRSLAACDLSQVAEKLGRIKYPRLPLSQPCSLMLLLIAGCGSEEPEVQTRLGGKELVFAG